MSEMERSKDRHGERADSHQADEPTQDPTGDDFEAHRHIDRNAERSDGGGHEAERHGAERHSD